MTRYNRLRREALQSCRLRGHVMKRFKKYHYASFRFNDLIGSAQCKRCSSWVQILTKPRPNEIEIGGDAVAKDCFIPDADSGQHGIGSGRQGVKTC